jgi:hypothetical protein
MGDKASPEVNSDCLRALLGLQASSDRSFGFLLRLKGTVEGEQCIFVQASPEVDSGQWTVLFRVLRTFFSAIR